MDFGARARSAARRHRLAGHAGRACCAALLALSSGIAAAQSTTPAGDVAAPPLPATAPSDGQLVADVDGAIEKKQFAAAWRLLEPMAERAGSELDALLSRYPMPLEPVEKAEKDEIRRPYGVVLKAALVCDSLAGESKADPARARAYAEEAVEHYLRAGTAALLLDDGQARRFYQRVLDYTPPNLQNRRITATAAHAAARLGLARALSKAGDLKAARDKYADYLRIEGSSTNYQAYAELGRLCIETGAYREAVKALEKAVEGGGAEAFHQRARALSGLGDRKQARLDIDTAIAKRPEKAEYYITKAGIMARESTAKAITEATGVYAQAIAVAEAGVEARLESRSAWKILVDCAAAQRNFLRLVIETSLRQGEVPGAEAVTRLAQTMVKLSEAEAVLMLMNVYDAAGDISNVAEETQALGAPLRSAIEAYRQEHLAGDAGAPTASTP